MNVKIVFIVGGTTLLYIYGDDVFDVRIFSGEVPPNGQFIVNMVDPNDTKLNCGITTLHDGIIILCQQIEFDIFGPTNVVNDPNPLAINSSFGSLILNQCNGNNKGPPPTTPEPTTPDPTTPSPTVITPEPTTLSPTPGGQTQTPTIKPTPFSNEEATLCVDKTCYADIDCSEGCGYDWTCDWRLNMCNQAVASGKIARRKIACRNNAGGIRRCG